MRVGRQEDAHEFLRQALDKMQDSAAANMTPPAKTDLEKERTLISRIFGGKLRSRVECASCKANSDTFDAIMDLSLDVSRASTVKEALQAFVRVDLLQGQNKYKCEKWVDFFPFFAGCLQAPMHHVSLSRCKKLVNARKSFSISEAPQILHIHFKRFTPTGRKITDAIGYPEELNLGPYMSDDASEVGFSLQATIAALARSEVLPSVHSAIRPTVSMLWSATLAAVLIRVTIMLASAPAIIGGRR